MFKRRPLNKNKNASPSSSNNAQTQQTKERPPNQGQRQGQPKGGNRGNRGPSRGGPQQQQQRQQSQGRHGQHRRHQNRPQPPPAYWQRDLLLIANKETSKPVEEVRNRFDPLSKKLPAHVTILFPEPAAKITSDILKKVSLEALPPLGLLTFKSIQVMDDMYLWLVPDEESAEKLKQWHLIFSQTLSEHTQGEKYEPHITLGYIPRKTPEEEALAFAQNLIATPLTLKFDNLLLEEFNEDQNSRSLDRLQVLV